MARRVELHTNLQDGRINLTGEREANLSAFLMREITDALSARVNLDHSWRESLMDYEGIPDEDYINIPVEGFKRIEVTIGAIASDTIYAQAKDLIFATSPLLTVRDIPKDRGDEETSAVAKAMQRFANWGAKNEFGTYDAVDDMILDATQLGTSLLYTLWRERRTKTKIATVRSFGPYTECMPPEDVIVPGGSRPSLEKLRWIAFRNWLMVEEFNERAKANNWRNTDSAQPVAVQDWVRQRRESVGRQMEGVTMKGKIYDALDVFVRYDIDQDGIAEDLLVTWNHTGQKILNVVYNPYENIPADVCRYQKRSHLFWGLGVMEMMRPYQNELSDLHNWTNLNMYLANCRFWKAKYGSVPDTMKIWPGKIQQMSDPKDLEAVEMADVYPSSGFAETRVMQLAERRVGVNELSNPRGSQVMGSRTPGITAMTMLQQANKRFVPAFGAMRDCAAGSVINALYRYKERLKAGNSFEIEEHITAVLGEEDGQHVIRTLKDENFEENVTVELTASSALVNRDADKQNSLLLVNILVQYYDRVLQLATLAANPQVPPEIKSVAQKIAKGAYEVIDRTVRTFDQVRDPALFLVDITEEFDKMETGAPNAMQGLMQLLPGGGGEGQAGPDFMQGGGMK